MLATPLEINNNVFHIYPSLHFSIKCNVQSRHLYIAKHDDYGPIWPISIAPWEVHICCIRPDNEETKKTADTLYEELQKRRVEVIYDDREGIRGGQMFADADLLGVPVRVVISPRNLNNNKIEITTRDKSVNTLVDVSDSLEYILELKEQLYLKLNA